jgi:hypothetical protein
LNEIEQLARLIGGEAGILARLDALERRELPTRWVDFTPTLTQNSAVSHTVNYARYIRVGKLAVVQLMLTADAAGTAGQAIAIASIPGEIEPAQGTPAVIGSFLIQDAGMANYAGAVIVASATTYQFVGHAETNNVGIDPNFALASGDVVSLMAAYEVA